MLLRSCLAGLAADAFALVPDALALVWLRLADLADLGGHLADQLLVGPGDLHHGVVFHREGDPGRRLVEHRVGIAHHHVEPALGGLGLVADALDLQHLLVALVHPLDHVGDQGAGQTVQRLVPGLLAGTGHRDGAVLHREDHLGVHGAGQLPLGALDPYRLTVDFRRDPGGDGHRLLADSRHGPSYQITASSSRPWWAARASGSDIRPLGVDTIAMPRPVRTRGISREFT